MDEFSFIEAIKQNHYKQSSLQRGIGDDAAVFHNGTNDIVVAVDTFVEGVHFTENTIDSYKLGYRALAANFSDLAAMGALPKYYLVSIVVPDDWKREKVLDIFQGMGALADHYRADLIGGDTVSGSGLVLSVTVIGEVEKGKSRYRNTAKPGDVVFVTGTLGDSRAGLHILQNKVSMEDGDYFIKRHQMPEPRIDFAYALKRIERLALNDISDGVGNEAHEIAEASEVTIVLYDEKIPVHPCLKQFSKEMQEDWKYFGGEDFELVGTVPEKDWPTVQETAEQMNMLISRVGFVTNKNKHAVYVNKQGTLSPLEKAGYTHLK